MLAGELISEVIPPVKTTDTVERVLLWMDEFHVPELPVVDQKKFRGLITEDALLNTADRYAIIGEMVLSHIDSFVTPSKHFFEVLRIAADKNITVVPVIQENSGDYRGVVSVKDSISQLANAYSSHNRGGIIIMELSMFDYSLSQISRYVEENNAKILSSYVETVPANPSMIRLTIKVNTFELDRIVSTLERFNFQIAATFSEEESSEWLQSRIDFIMKYIDI